MVMFRYSTQSARDKAAKKLRAKGYVVRKVKKKLLYFDTTNKRLSE